MLEKMKSQDTPWLRYNLKRIFIALIKDVPFYPRIVSKIINMLLLHGFRFDFYYTSPHPTTFLTFPPLLSPCLFSKWFRAVVAIAKPFFINPIPMQIPVRRSLTVPNPHLKNEQDCNNLLQFLQTYGMPLKLMPNLSFRINYSLYDEFKTIDVRRFMIFCSLIYQNVMSDKDQSAIEKCKSDFFAQFPDCTFLHSVNISAHIYQFKMAFLCYLCLIPNHKAYWLMIYLEYFGKSYCNNRAMMECSLWLYKEDPRGNIFDDQFPLFWSEMHDHALIKLVEKVGLDVPLIREKLHKKFDFPSLSTNSFDFLNLNLVLERSIKYSQLYSNAAIRFLGLQSENDQTAESDQNNQTVGDQKMEHGEKVRDEKMYKEAMIFLERSHQYQKRTAKKCFSEKKK